jgi:hypothetical protein
MAAYSIYKILQEAVLDNNGGMIIRQENKKTERQAYKIHKEFFLNIIRNHHGQNPSSVPNHSPPDKL